MLTARAGDEVAQISLRVVQASEAEARAAERAAAEAEAEARRTGEQLAGEPVVYEEFEHISGERRERSLTRRELFTRTWGWRGRRSEWRTFALLPDGRYVERSTRDGRTIDCEEGSWELEYLRESSYVITFHRSLRTIGGSRDSSPHSSRMYCDIRGREPIYLACDISSQGRTQFNYIHDPSAALPCL